MLKLKIIKTLIILLFTKKKIVSIGLLYLCLLLNIDFILFLKDKIINKFYPLIDDKFIKVNDNYKLLKKKKV